MEIPFGKYKGRTLDEIPSDYLRWVLNDIDENQYPGLFEEIEEELAIRDRSYAHFYS